ncbi:MAG: VOC family protein [Thermoplasmata archaeon]
MSPGTGPELRHVSIEVHDIPVARAFYDAFLGRLGFRRFVHEPTYLGYTNGSLTFWVLHGAPLRVRRAPPTGEEEVIADHFAFWVPNASTVEAIQNDLIQREVYPLVRSAERPEFRPGYVSAIWSDPDGVVLEVYTTGATKARPRRTTGTKSRRRPATPSHRPAHRRVR